MTAEGKGMRKGQGGASIAIAALAAALVVAGLALGGGPIQARKERRDQARMDDLNTLSGHIGCLSRQGDRFTMPADFAATDECPGPVPLKDPYTGADYRIEPLDDGKYRLCAAFELPADYQPRWSARWRNGDCIVEELPRRAPTVPGQPAVEVEPPVVIDKVD